MSEEYPTVLHRWFEEVWNQGREDLICEIFPPEGLAHGLGDEPVRGGEEYKTFFRNFKSALPDVQISIEQTVREGDLLSVRCRARATHTGDGLGLAPTNRAVDFTFMAIARVTDDQILEAWNIVDFMTMYKQMDVLAFK